MKSVLFWNLAAVTALALGAPAQTKTTTAPLALEVYFAGMCPVGAAGVPMELAGTSKTYCLQMPALVSAKEVASAEFDPHAYDKSTIQLTLKDDAARRFKEVTGKSIGLQVGVVLSGRLVSVATIAAPSGNVWISGLPHHTAELVIRAFPPPAPR